MKNEDRRRLDDTRLAHQVWLVVTILAIIGVGLICFSPNLHWRAIGYFAAGIGGTLLIAPRLKIWKA
jgi:hypothetical protein